MTDLILAGIPIAVSCLVGLYVLLRRERAKRIAAEKTAADLEAAWAVAASAVQKRHGAVAKG